MHKVLVLGAGKIGALISGLLAESGAYQVQLADVDETAAAGVARAHGLPTVEPVRLDATDAAALRYAAAGAARSHAVVSSLPYHCNPLVGAAARDGRHPLLRPDRGRRSHAARQRAGARLRRRRSCRSAGWRRVSSASPAAS